MFATLITSSHFLAFLAASVLLAITPGPGVLYILTQTLSQGRKAGLASVCGIALGNLGNAVAASVGLAAVFAVSSAAFTVVKLAGAAYLIWLGIKTLRSRAAVAAEVRVDTLSPGRLFRDGSLVALFNPKTALFFAALLPQFMDPHAPPLGQSLLFGCIFVWIALCTDSLYALAAAAVATTLRRRSAWGRYGKYLSAASFFGLGMYAAIATPRSAK
jgi:threonine/homoserine/homoserine lactone efflux protein